MTSPSTCQKSLAPCILFVARKKRTLSFRLLLVLSIPIKDRIYDRVGLIPHETLNRLCARTVFIGFVLCKRFRRADGLKNGVEPTPHRITLRPPKVAVSPRVHDRSLNLPPIDVHLPLNLRVTKSEKSDQNREEHVPVCMLSHELGQGVHHPFYVNPHLFPLNIKGGIFRNHVLSQLRCLVNGNG